MPPGLIYHARDSHIYSSEDNVRSFLVVALYMNDPLQSQDLDIYNAAQRNPFLGLNLMYNYAVVQQTITTATHLLRVYFDVLNLQGVNPRDKKDVPAIAQLHFLFNILHYYKKHVDCQDTKSVDCMFYKKLIETYKAAGFYEAYIKFAAQQQIENYLGGGMGSIRCFMYIIAFTIFSLLEVQPIFIDRLSDYVKQRDIELRVYREQPPKDVLLRLGLTKLFSMSNRFGSSTFQSLLFGNTPETVRAIAENKIKPEFYTKQFVNSIAGFAAKYVGYDKPAEFVLLQGMKLPGVIPTTGYTNIEDIRAHARDIHTHLIQIYEMPGPMHAMGPALPTSQATAPYQSYYANFVTAYMSKVLPDSVTGASATNYARYREYIDDLHGKLHLSELAASTQIDFENEPLIITFVAYIKDNTFNLLYNTQNGRMCIFDLNVLDKIMKAANHAVNKISTGDFYIEYEPEETKNRLKQLGEFLKRTAGMTPLLPEIPVFIAERGFWSGSGFERNPNFGNINVYVRNIFEEYIDVANIMRDPGGPSPVYVENMYSLSSDMSDIVTNNVYGWGCSTLNNCGESAIELLVAYSEMLQANRIFTKTINAADVLLDARNSKWSNIVTKGVNRYMAPTPSVKEALGANLYSGIIPPDIPYVEKVDKTASNVNYSISQLRKLHSSKNTGASSKGGGRKRRLRRRRHTTRRAVRGN